MCRGGEHRVPPNLAWVRPDVPEKHLTVHLTVSICLCLCILSLCVSLSGIISPCPSAPSLQPARASILHLDHVSHFLECSTLRTFLPIPHLPLCPLSRAWAGVTSVMSPNPGSCSLLQDPFLAMPQTPPPAPSSMPCLFFGCHMLKRKVRRVWMDTQRAGVQEHLHTVCSAGILVAAVSQ